jgi:hypothetical protein
MNGKWDTPKLRRTTSQYHAVDARRASQRPDTRSSYGPSFMALRVPRTFDGPAFGGVLDVLLPTPPTAPESAYRVVEPLQNAAPERRPSPSNQQRRTALLSAFRQLGHRSRRTRSSGAGGDTPYPSICSARVVVVICGQAHHGGILCW